LVKVAREMGLEVRRGDEAEGGVATKELVAVMVVALALAMAAAATAMEAKVAALAAALAAVMVAAAMALGAMVLVIGEEVAVNEVVETAAGAPAEAGKQVAAVLVVTGVAARMVAILAKASEVKVDQAQLLLGSDWGMEVAAA